MAFMQLVAPMEPEQVRRLGEPLAPPGQRAILAVLVLDIQAPMAAVAAAVQDQQVMDQQVPQVLAVLPALLMAELVERLELVAVMPVMVVRPAVAVAAAIPLPRKVAEAPVARYLIHGADNHDYCIDYHHRASSNYKCVWNITQSTSIAEW